MITFTPPRQAPEIKTGDLYCSGFVRTDRSPTTLKVISRFDGDVSALATEADYIYLEPGFRGRRESGQTLSGHSANQDGSTVRTRRPMRNLGLHYLDVAQIQVVIAQADFCTGAGVHSCEAVEVGDFMIPFQRIDLPADSTPRPFIPFMNAPANPGSVIIDQERS